MNYKYKTDICRLTWGICDKYGNLLNEKIKKNKIFNIINYSLFIFFGLINVFLIIMIVFGLKK